MKINKKLSISIVAFLVAFKLMNAQTSLLTPIDTTSLNTWTTSGNPTVYGERFTVGSSDLYVSRLGVFDSLQNGLETSTEVGIWNSTGSLLGSVSIGSGVSGDLLGNFRYADLSSVVQLTAGSTYRIGALVGGTGGISYIDSGSASVNTYSLSSDVVFNSSVFNTVAGFSNPSNSYFSARWYSADMIYSTVAIPEPTTFMILGLGIVTFIFKRMRSQKLI